MPSNVEKFSAYAAAVLDRLYDNFPLPITVQDTDYVPPDDFMRKVHELDHEGSQVALTKHREWLNDREIFAGTVRFLIDEGFIRYNPEISSDRTFVSVMPRPPVPPRSEC